MAESDGSWEEHSVTSETFGQFSDSSDNDDSDNGVDEEPESDDLSNDDIGVDDDGGPALVVRGVQPYRYEPLAPAQAENAGEEPRDGEALPHNMDRLLNTEWCSCGKCAVMEDVINCKCCKEVEQLTTKLDELDPRPNVSCFTEHPWFEATALNPGTLQTAYYAYRQQYGPRAIEAEGTKKFRHIAYRQIVRWCWGFLGRHNRVPLPACVMLEIRRTYPEADGNYKGFQFPPLDDL